jgi:hypothetical protein
MLDEVRDRQAGHACVFLTPFAIRIMAEGTGARIRPLSVRHDVGHRRVVAWKPVGWPETVGDLLSREGERAARKLLD